jgi:hypothetical protein
MDRRVSPETLIEYHFGTLEGPARAEVEAALLASAEALRAYLRLKRELDGASGVDDVPSPAAKARLTAAVAGEVAHRRLRVPTPGRGAAAPKRAGILGVFWRPVPLYQTMAVAAAVAVLVGVLGMVGGRHDDDGEGDAQISPRGPAPAAVDYAGPSPLALEVL